MASLVTKKVAKHVLKENAQNHFGSDDPYFEHVAAVDLSGRTTGKYTKRKRAVPPGLTKQEEKVLKKVTRRAYRLDNCLNICGIRVGWSAVIGLIPAAGDIVDALMAFMVVWTATKASIPATLKSRMIMNIALDFAVGLVPFLGDVADAFFRCNTRNAALLWKHLQDRGAARILEEEGAGAGGRDSSRRRTNKSPGRNMQEKRPQSNRQTPQMDQTLEHSDQHRGRQEIPLNEKTPASNPRQHSSRRGNEATSATPGSGRFVTARDISTQQDQAQSSKSGRSGWSDWFSTGSKRPGARDIENGDVRPSGRDQR